MSNSLTQKKLTYINLLNKWHLLMTLFYNLNTSLKADHTANVKTKDNHRSDKQSNHSITSFISEKKNIVILGDSMIKHVNG